MSLFSLFLLLDRYKGKRINMFRERLCCANKIVSEIRIRNPSLKRLSLFAADGRSHMTKEFPSLFVFLSRTLQEDGCFFIESTSLDKLPVKADDLLSAH